METVQGGVPPYGVKETLVVNGGKKYNRADTARGDQCKFNSIQLLYSRLNSIIYIQVVHDNLRSI